MRISEEEINLLPPNIVAQIKAAMGDLDMAPAKKAKVKPVKPAPKGEGYTLDAEPAPSKYHNQPVVLDGFDFDSKREAARYEHLKALQAVGTIAGLQLQVPFALVVNGVSVGDYVADFTYRIVDTDTYVIEDVKGAKTAVYCLKRNIMDALGHHIREISNAKSPAGWDERAQPKKVNR